MAHFSLCYYVNQHDIINSLLVLAGKLWSMYSIWLKDVNLHMAHSKAKPKEHSERKKKMVVAVLTQWAAVVVQWVTMIEKCHKLSFLIVTIESRNHSGQRKIVNRQKKAYEWEARINSSSAWWPIPVFTALRWQSQDDQEFQTSWNYPGRFCL